MRIEIPSFHPERERERERERDSEMFIQTVKGYGIIGPMRALGATLCL
jgi:hypothetical protein